MSAASTTILASSSGELPPVSSTIGALFLGWGISMLIFGLLCLQTWTYFSRYPNDSPRNKLLVASLCVLEIVHQVCIGHTCWVYSITEYGSLEKVLLGTTVWSLSAIIVLSGIIAATVKIFLGWRIYRVSQGNYLWMIFLSGLALTQTGLGLVFSVRAVDLPVAELGKLKTIATVALAIGAVGDIIAALVLSFYLHTMRTGFLKSGRLLNRLIVFSVNTGALTAAFSLAAVIAFQVMPDNFIYLSIYFFVCKLYSNSCLATFNSRTSQAAANDSFGLRSVPTAASHDLSMMRPRVVQKPSLDVEGGSERQANIQIGVHREAFTTVDDKPFRVSEGSVVIQYESQ
ncbi:unnamed protein product [Peniophora sp. CBMAI 1063]|nr:unnamed protein product [Peniophora sp. CBMAI 1063]